MGHVLLPCTSIVETETDTGTRDVVAGTVALLEQWDEVILDVRPDTAGILLAARGILLWWRVRLMRFTRGTVLVAQTAHDLVVDS